jgi:hypothetical protein
MVLVPEALGPGSVNSLDDVIMLCLTRRNEDQFHAQIQSQAHKSSEDARGAPQPCETGIVIDLPKVRDAQLRAGLQHVLTGCHCSLVAAAGLRQSV